MGRTLPGMDRSASKEATRAALIAAGIEELSEKGLSAPSLDAICARAGFTRGAFYVHFADRDAFLVAVMDQVLGTFVTAMMSRTNDTPSIETAIRLFTHAARDRAPEVHSGGAMRFHHLMEACRASPIIGERYRALMTGIREHLTAQIAEGQARGTVRRGIDSAHMGQLMLSSALGIVAMLELSIEVDPVAIGETVIGFLKPPAKPRTLVAPKKPRRS